MFQKIKSKLKSRAGLSLTEMIITVLVLALFSSACLVGITTALKARQEAIKAADADILCSTITQYISQQMRLSLKNPDVSDPKKFIYEGGASEVEKTAGKSELFLNDDDEPEYEAKDKGYLVRVLGEKVEPDGTLKKNVYKVFNDSAYSGLTLKDLKFDDCEKPKLRCTFDIVDADGNTVKSADFTVTQINQ